MIVYPTKDSMKKLGAVLSLLGIWLISFLMASPSLLFKFLYTESFIYGEFHVYHVKCLEKTDIGTERKAYSVASMVVQYAFPFVILSVAHLRICNKLRYRMVTSQNATATTATSALQREKNERRSRRKRKTNLLLAGIASVFAVAWLPLNVCNLLADFLETGLTDYVDVTLTFAICHLCVLSSACINPVLYGWLNDNFHTEFVKILCCPCCKLLRVKLARALCCPKKNSRVPAITLTKVGNGHSLGLDLDQGLDNLEKSSCDTRLTVQYQTQ